MRLSIAAFIFLASSFALANSQTFTITGMHCKSCAKSIEAKLCKEEGMEKCEVSVGQAVIVPKAGYQFTSEQIQKLVSQAGDKYKVTDVKTEK